MHREYESSWVLIDLERALPGPLEPPQPATRADAISAIIVATIATSPREDMGGL